MDNRQTMESPICNADATSLWPCESDSVDILYNSSLYKAHVIPDRIEIFSKNHDHEQPTGIMSITVCILMQILIQMQENIYSVLLKLQIKRIVQPWWSNQLSECFLFSASFAWMCMCVCVCTQCGSCLYDIQ